MRVEMDPDRELRRWSVVRWSSKFEGRSSSIGRNMGEVFSFARKWLPRPTHPDHANMSVAQNRHEGS